MKHFVKMIGLVALVNITIVGNAKAAKPVDLMFEVQQIVDELDGWFKGPYKPHHKKQFALVRHDYNKRLTKTCNELHALTKRTGNLNSEYYDEFTACNDFKFGLLKVLQSLNSGNYKEIPKIRQRFEPQYQNIKKQVDIEKQKTKGMSIKELLERANQSK
tara:strand:+ start:409 stop:888 length:480 start_codon:yes stop_codon:yes gene_type:complete